MISQAGDLARRLARDAEAVCRHYLSNGCRRGRYWVAGDVMNTPGRSLYVRLHGPDSGPGAAGKWTDAATGEHGDLLDLIRRNRDLPGLGDAMDEARAFLALPRPPEPSALDRRRRRADLPRPPAACSAPAVRLPAPRPRPICAPAASPDGSTGPPCATTRPSTTAKPRTPRSKPGRLSSPP